MDFLQKIKEIFNIDNFEVSERMKIVEISFEVATVKLPNKDTFLSLFDNIPLRDTLHINFNIFEDCFSFSNRQRAGLNEYDTFVDSLELDDIVCVEMTIKKEVSENVFSIYDFNLFAQDINNLPIKQVMSAFSLLLNGINYLIFDLFDQDYFFTTKTMIFAPTNKNIVCNFDAFIRANRIQDCKDTSYFYNLSTYQIIPDDFYLEVDFEYNPLSEVFNKLTTILSLTYIASSSSIIDEMLSLQISGQRSLECTYNLQNIKYNLEFYKIFNWIYTDGSPIDKSLIARNIISLHCKFTELLDIDEKTLSSIQSNFSLYLKSSVNQYLELKNKLAEFICNVVSKTGEYTTLLLKDFKNNLIAILVFLFSVILANIVSSQPLENIFTNDITAIFECVLLGSFIYLVICVFEANYKIKKVCQSYNSLKMNYDNILSPMDIKEIFKNDELINSMVRSVKKGKWIYTILWLAFILGAFFILENISEFGVLKQ